MKTYKYSLTSQNMESKEFELATVEVEWQVKKAKETRGSW